MLKNAKIINPSNPKRFLEFEFRSKHLAVAATAAIPMNEDWKFGLPKKPNTLLLELFQSNGSAPIDCKMP